eukprot:687902-Rhodomonas_salina.1
MPNMPQAKMSSRFCAQPVLTAQSLCQWRDENAPFRKGRYSLCQQCACVRAKQCAFAIGSALPILLLVLVLLTL